MRRLTMKLSGATCCLLLFACDIPTALPVLEQRWILPLEQVEVRVDQLLPTGIQFSEGALEVDIDTFSTSASLNSLCTNCNVLNGSTAVVPSFTSSFSTNVDLPENIIDLEISGGSVQVKITNGLAFDPLAGGGVISATISDMQGGSTLANFFFDGSLPPGGTVAQSLSLDSASIGTTVLALIEVTSLGGQIAPIDTNEQLSVDIVGSALVVSSGTVSIENHSFEIDAIELDLEHIGQEVTERILNGSLIFDVVNPFGVSMSGNIKIGSTSKDFSIDESGMSTTEIHYTGSELRSFLGKKGVTLSVSGTATGNSGKLAPGQELTIKGKVDCLIRIG